MWQRLSSMRTDTIFATFLPLLLVASLSSGCASSAPPVNESDASPQVITVSGVITSEGAECVAMRGDDGKLYTLGRPKDLAPGDRVRITGTLAEASFCMQGITLNVTRIERLPERPGSERVP